MEQFFVDILARIEDLHRYYFEYMDGLSVEQLDWKPASDMNSLCVLAVHVTQAERYWVGLGVDAPIERNRDAEFLASGFSVDDLKARFTQNQEDYKKILATASISQFADEVTVALFPERTWTCTRGWALLHALDHTAEHLGHAGMTRQLLNAQQTDA